MCRQRWYTLPCTSAALLLAAVAPALAAEVVVQNDSLADGSQGTPCQCFIPGDEVAAWLTAPFNGRIVAVQVYWKSTFGGNPPSQETAIRIYSAGAFPTPGAVMQNDTGGSAVVQAPVLSDFTLNEFRHLDQAQTLPLSVPINPGQTFVVALEILNQSSGNPFASDVVWDTDGCQAGKNAVITTPPGTWLDACGQGVTGDWMIRAIIERGEPIPVLSGPGLAAMAVLLVAVGTAVIRRA